MTADTCNDGRRGNYSTNQIREGAAYVISRDVPATCPDCGRAMVRDARNVRHLICTSCGNSQHLDVLRPSAAARQASALHDRGLDRILNAIGD